MLHPINWSLALPYYAAAFCFGYLQEAQLFGLLTVLIWAKHHHNIARLVAGTESKIGR